MPKGQYLLLLFGTLHVIIIIYVYLCTWLTIWLDGLVYTVCFGCKTWFQKCHGVKGLISSSVSNTQNILTIFYENKLRTTLLMTLWCFPIVFLIIFELPNVISAPDFVSHPWTFFSGNLNTGDIHEFQMKLIWFCRFPHVLLPFIFFLPLDYQDDFWV